MGASRPLRACWHGPPEYAGFETRKHPKPLDRIAQC